MLNQNESQVLQDLPVRPDREFQAALEEGRALQSADVIAIVLTGLFAIAVIGTLAIAKTLIMPMTAALIVGTTLSAGARALEKYRIPRTLSVVLVLIASGGTVPLV